MRLLITSLLALLLLVYNAPADTVVLKSGESHEGIIANRDQILENPTQQRLITLMPAGEDTLQRYPVTDIAHVSFSGNPPKVIDFTTLESIIDEDTPGEVRNDWSRTGLKRKGTVSMVCGSGLLLIGMTVPMGTETVTLPSGEEKELEETGVLNYVFVVGGILLAAYGVSLLVQSSKQEGFGLRVLPSREGMRVALCYQHGF